MISTVIAKFLGRNYHLALLICICAFFLCIGGHMSGGEYATLVGGVFSAFRAGDAIVNYIHRDKNDDLDESHRKRDDGQSNNGER